MEVLPVSSSHFIRSPQIELSPGSESFACDRRFRTAISCLSSNVSPPRPATLAVPRRKEKVVFVLGSTGTGKSKLAIDLAAHFGGEVVNSDKMQVYDGLSVITNKVTDEECAGVPHHLIGGVHPDADFTAADFRHEATKAVESIIARGRVPIIAGGSNTYIEELVDGEGGKFRSAYDCFFLWIDVSLPVLHGFVDARVDKMVESGLVDEARGMFDPAADYSRGVRRSIGVPELDRYFRAELSLTSDQESKEALLRGGIADIKANTRDLTYRQLEKIRRLAALPGWDVHRIDVTEALLRKGERDGEEVWAAVGREPAIKKVEKFLMNASALKKMIVTLASDEAVTAAVTAANGGGTAAVRVNGEPAVVGATRPH